MERSVQAQRSIQQAAGKLVLTVLFTDVPATRAALNEASKLARDLDASFRIVVMRIVPYPLPLDRSPVASSFTNRQLAEIASALAVETTIHIYDCRDPEESLLQFLAPDSIVVLGIRRSWWRTREKRLARKLRRAGHNVFVADADSN